MQFFIDMMPIIIAVLFFLLVIVVSLNFRAGDVIVRTYERVGKGLRERKNHIFDYEKSGKFLLANGATYHYGKLLDPIKFLILRLLSMTLLFVIGISVHAVCAVVFMLIGYFVPVLVLYRKNKKDNDAMVPQLLNVYNTLRVQLRAGVHITNAISECYRGLPKGRFRKGLEELSGDIFLKSSMKDAVHAFNAKFNNGSVDTLCSLILQAGESGLVVELLGDVGEQIRDMQAAQLSRKKEKLDRHMILYAIIIVAAALLPMMYVYLKEGYGILSSF